MPVSSGTFTLTITTNASFGERVISEDMAIADLLRQVAAQVGAGRPSAPIIDRNHNTVGSYSFGAGMVSAGR